ncbi:MAG: aminopeptidase, partial [Telluria sp.]
FGNPGMREAYDKYRARKTDFLALLLRYRKELELTYKSPIPDDAKRKAKAELFAHLKDDYQLLKASWGGYAGYDLFFAEPLTNAHLASIATYNDFVPAFRALLAKEKSFPAFYREVKRIAELDRGERHRVLKKLGGAELPALPLLQRTIGAQR